MIKKYRDKQIIDILNRYNWDIDKVTKHQDYTNKYCPHRTLDLGWDRFINMIKDKLSETRARPFVVGEILYNKEDLYLHETAGYGGGLMLLKKDTKSVVKKYHYNKGLYMALGDTNSYYDAAWTDEYSKFTTEEPIVPDEPSVPEEPKEDNNDDINKDNTKEEDNTKDDNKDKDNEIELPVQDRENPLLWLLDKIIKFIVKLFKGRKK